MAKCLFTAYISVSLGTNIYFRQNLKKKSPCELQEKFLILLLASFFEYLGVVPDGDLDQTCLDSNHFVAVFVLASHEQFEFFDLLFYDDASKPKLSKIKLLLSKNLNFQGNHLIVDFFGMFSNGNSFAKLLILN